jgi:hypothetical protein
VLAQLPTNEDSIFTILLIFQAYLYMKDFDFVKWKLGAKSLGRHFTMKHLAKSLKKTITLFSFGNVPHFQPLALFLLSFRHVVSLRTETWFPSSNNCCLRVFLFFAEAKACGKCLKAAAGCRKRSSLFGISAYTSQTLFRRAGIYD